MNVRRPLRFLMAAILAAGCGDSATNPFDTPANVTSVAVDSAAGPIYRTLTVNLDRPAQIQVEYASAGLPTLRVSSNSFLAQQVIFLPRLYADRQYSYSVHAFSTAGKSGNDFNGTFHTASLPAEIAAFQWTSTGTATNPLTLIEVMVSTNGFSGALIVDQKGQVVWYYKQPGFLLGTAVRSNGNYVLLADSGLTEVTPTRQVVHTLRNGAGAFGNIHHDLTVTPQNTIYFLARENRVIRDTTVVGEAIWEWNPENGTTVKKWSAWDFFDWDTQRGRESAPDNWMHANTVAFGPRGNLVVSFRNMDQVFSIASDFKSLEWIIGGPGGNMQISDPDKFYAQHSSIEYATDRVLMLDNGFGRPNGQTWSRVLELQLDRTAKTAHKVWEFRPQPDNNNIRVGSARRLANGNTFALFGWGQGSPIVVYELNPAGTPVYSLTATDGSDRLYRATPLTTIGGEQVVP